MKMIVIGASAGGLDPIKVILADLAVALDAAVLVIRHSSPGGPSLLAPILARYSVLPVTEVRDYMRIEPGWVYVAPSGITVTIEMATRSHAVFRTGVLPHVHGDGRPSIDQAMVSAANVFTHSCIGVILSGYLKDGSKGAIAVDQGNGTIIVQSPSDAEHSSMPLSVIHARCPAFILQDTQIGSMLCDLVQQEELDHLM